MPLYPDDSGSTYAKMKDTWQASNKYLRLILISSLAPCAWICLLIWRPSPGQEPPRCLLNNTIVVPLKGEKYENYLIMEFFTHIWSFVRGAEGGCAKRWGKNKAGEPSVLMPLSLPGYSPHYAESRPRRRPGHYSYAPLGLSSVPGTHLLTSPYRVARQLKWLSVRLPSLECSSASQRPELVVRDDQGYFTIKLKSHLCELNYCLHNLKYHRFSNRQQKQTFYCFDSNKTFVFSYYVKWNH